MFYFQLYVFFLPLGEFSTPWSPLVWILTWMNPQIRGAAAAD